MYIEDGVKYLEAEMDGEIVQMEYDVAFGMLAELWGNDELNNCHDPFQDEEDRFEPFCPFEDMDEALDALNKSESDFVITVEKAYMEYEKIFLED